MCVCLQAPLVALFNCSDADSFLLSPLYNYKLLLSLLHLLATVSSSSFAGSLFIEASFLSFFSHLRLSFRFNVFILKHFK